MSGEIVVYERPDPREDEIESLRAEVRRLSRAVEDANRAAVMLRRQLSPLYKALQAVFGELDAVGGDDGPESAPASDPKTTAVWGAWKQRLGGQCAKVVDALLLHGEMNTTQLAIAVGTRRQNIPNLIYKLNQAGLLNKNGGRFSLKQL